jgi:ATPases of the AAA+ class
MSGLRDSLLGFVESHYPALCLIGKDEFKVDVLIHQLIGSRSTFEWNMARGLVDFSSKHPYRSQSGDANKNLSHAIGWMLDQAIDNPVFVIKDLSIALKENPQAIAGLKELFLQSMRREDQVTIFLVASQMVIPQELENYVTVFDIPLPSEAEITALIESFCKAYDLNPSDIVVSSLAQSCQGLAEFEINQLLLRAFQSNGQLDEEDKNLINHAKAQIIRKSGKLDVVQVRESLSDIGGLNNLKGWLKRKAKVLDQWSNASKFGVEPPKGILIAGMPGCGKSLTAKAASKLFNLPLLRLDMGSLMGRFVGESENNMRQAIQIAEAISPCVLWIDEIEKAFVGVGGHSSGNSEVSTRMFGYFLTWMQEKTSQVFVIATANDLSALPVELLRKGRFDEMFYVDFPNLSERKKIFEVHLRKRNKFTQDINLDHLAEITRNYSGADIESVIKETIETAFIDRKHIDTDLLESTIKNTRPLGDVLKDKIKEYEQRFKEMHIKPAS